MCESAPQSLSMTPSKPQCCLSTALDIHPFAQDGVPLMASYAHIAPETFALSIQCLHA